MSLLLGCAKLDITPERPIPLSGFAVRLNKPFERIATPIQLRAAVLQQADAQGAPAGAPALIVSADLLWWGTDRMERIRGELGRRWGLTPERIILSATHSHSGPQPSFRFHRLLGAPDSDYVELLERKLFEAVETSFAGMEPVTVERGRGECRNGVQRRKYVDGRVFGGAFPDGIIDNEVNVIRYARQDGSVKSLMVHYACHPVTTSDNALSSEFTGHAMERLERELDGSVCLFLQGCCADINIHTETAAPSAKTGQEKIEYFGERLADSVNEVLSRPMELLPEAPLGGVQTSIPLELRPLAGRQELQDLAATGASPYDEWAQTMLQRFDSRETALTMEFTRVDVAQGLSFLAMNAEVVVEYGLYVKERNDGVLPMGYANGMLGYVPLAYQLRTDSYESDSSTYYFHMPARLQPEIETPVRAVLEQLTENKETEEAR